MTKGIRYQKLPEMFGEGLTATFKGVSANIYECENYILIYTIESKNEGKGECREFLKLLKEKYPIVKSSIPLTRRWEKFCEKNQIEVINN